MPSSAALSAFTALSLTVFATDCGQNLDLGHRTTLKFAIEERKKSAFRRHPQDV